MADDSYWIDDGGDVTGGNDDAASENGGDTGVGATGEVVSSPPLGGYGGGDMLGLHPPDLYGNPLLNLSGADQNADGFPSGGAPPISNYLSTLKSLQWRPPTSPPSSSAPSLGGPKSPTQRVISNLARKSPVYRRPNAKPFLERASWMEPDEVEPENDDERQECEDRDT